VEILSILLLNLLESMSTGLLLFSKLKRFQRSLRLSPEPAPEARAQGGTFTQFPDLPEPPSAAALSGQLSNYDMVKEVSRMFDGLTEQLTAFRDVYDSPAITSKKTAKSKSPSTTEKMDSTG